MERESPHRPLRANGARIAGFIIILALAAAVGASSAAGAWWVPVPAVLVAIAALLIIRWRRTDVVSDERDTTIAARAARLSYAMYGPAAAAIGATLIAIPSMRIVGYTLAYSVCALLVINVAATLWLRRRAL